MLRWYKEKVKLVITSPPYLDITDYHGGSVAEAVVSRGSTEAYLRTG
jgi:hypothetical protein